MQEEKKAKVEKKLEENARLEKEQMRKDKMELLAERRTKQHEVKKIEQKVNRIKAVSFNRQYLFFYTGLVIKCWLLNINVKFVLFCSKRTGKYKKGTL